MYQNVKTTPMGVFTDTGTGVPVSGPAARTFQVSIAGTGAITSTVIIEASNDGVSYITLATVTQSYTTTGSDGVVSAAAYALVRARVTGITGTGATITVTQAG